ncbi:MAG: hypothetical protein ACKOD7_05020 [Polynucleobacter victoriensis]
MGIKEIVAQGVELAKQASIAKYDQMGRKDAYACGFAWVDVYVSRTNSKEAKELLAAGFRKDYKPKCLSMWNPGDLPVQNIDIKEAGAYAMAEFLRTNGLNAYAGSRLD